MAVFAAGALRALSTLAYQPAIIYYDSVDYLNRAVNFEPGQARPLGYSAFLWALPGDSLATIPLAQHLMGLGIGVLIYVLLCRLGVRPWAAALAAAPCCSTPTSSCLRSSCSPRPCLRSCCAGCTALLWGGGRGAEAAMAGALFAGVALTRANGVIVIAPALLALVCLRWDVAAQGPALDPAGGRCARAGLRPAGGRVRGLVPHRYGTYAITSTAATSSTAGSPLRGLQELLGARRGADPLPGAGGGPPPPPPGLDRELVHVGRLRQQQVAPVQAAGRARPRVPAGRFARRAILAQPWDYFQAVSHDFLRGFAPIRTRHDNELPISRWQYSAGYPVYSKFTPAMLRAHGDAPGKSRPGLGRALRDYQRFGFTWGPVLALGLIAGLAAILGLGRARRSGLRTATFLFVATAS